MEGGALSDEGFPKFAETVVLFCHITSRVTTDKDQNLLTEKGGGGFPYLVYMDADGHVLSEIGDRSIEGITKARGPVDTYFKARAAADKGDKSAKVDVLLSEMDFGIVKKDDGEAKLKGMGKLTEAQEKLHQSVLVNLEVKEWTSGSALGRKFLEMQKAGKIPTKDDLVEEFYKSIMTYGEGQKDAAAFEIGFKGMRTLYERIYAGNPQVQQWITEREEILKGMKEGHK